MLNTHFQKIIIYELQNYLNHGEIEETIHIVDIGAVFEAKCLYECNIDKFPPSWQTFIRNSKTKKKKKNCD